MVEERSVENDAIIKAEKKLSKLKTLKLNIASISDIHLNHPNTPTEMIVRNLMLYAFPDTELTRNLDIIFIGGDVTDRLMDFGSESSIIYRQWVAHLLWFCKRNDILLRIIKGTPLHDWDQSYIFIEENINHSIGCDVKYFDDIAIEHIDKFDIDVLYIPDEIRPSTDITWDCVCRLMEERGLTKVQYAVMHGAFGYQLPEIAALPGKVHDKDKYESIVEHYIFVGHIHQHRPNGKVIPNGSFDRLAQGEEDVKGHVRLINGKIEFIPNLGAMRYFKVDAVGKDPKDIIDEIRERTDGNPDKFKVLLLANTGDVAFELIKKLAGIFSNGVFDVQNVQKQKQRTERKATRSIRLDSLPKLTRGNLLDELIKEIESSPLDDLIIHEACERARRTINAIK